MTEDEVNLKVKEWLNNHSFKYKGILNKGLGQVPVPDGTRQVLIDHQGVKDNPVDLLWVEAKGGDCSLSELLEGFIRVGYAVWHGAGRGLLAAPAKEIRTLKKQREFLASVSASLVGKGMIGLLDAQSGKVMWFQ